VTLPTSPLSPPPRSSLFPYTTLFRSLRLRLGLGGEGDELHGGVLVLRDFRDGVEGLVQDGLVHLDGQRLALSGEDDHARAPSIEIGRAHIWTPVTDPTRMPASS